MTATRNHDQVNRKKKKKKEEEEEERKREKKKKNFLESVLKPQLFNYDIYCFIKRSLHLWRYHGQKHGKSIIMLFVNNLFRMFLFSL